MTAKRDTVQKEGWCRRSKRKINLNGALYHLHLSLLWENSDILLWFFPIIYQFLHIPDTVICIYLYIHICVCVLNCWRPCHTSLRIHMVIFGNSQTTHLCRTRGHTWKMIIGRNERRGMWRLSHLQENVENDVQEFSGEQGSPLFGCLCCISGWLLFGTSSHSNDFSSWNVHFLMILSDCFTLGHQTKVLINNLFGLTF